MYLITLTQARAYLSLKAAETADDAGILDACRQATDLITKYQRRRFDCRLETRYFNKPKTSTLRLDEDLLAIASLLNGDATAILATSYWLIPTVEYPKHDVLLKPGSGISWLSDPTNGDTLAIPLQGYWGYHEDYAAAWQGSGDTVRDSPLSAVAVTMIVSDWDGAANDGDLPRFQIGQQLKLYDSTNVEFVTVNAITPGTNTLGITRAQNGTTARAWPQSTTIAIWRVWQNVLDASGELVKVLYHLRAQTPQGVEQIVGTGIRVTPQTLPKHVIKMLHSPKVSLR